MRKRISYFILISSRFRFNSCIIYRGGQHVPIKKSKGVVHLTTYVLYPVQWNYATKYNFNLHNTFLCNNISPA